MAAVNVIGIAVMNNPGKFTDKLSFEITLECVAALGDGKFETIVCVSQKGGRLFLPCFFCFCLCVSGFVAHPLLSFRQLLFDSQPSVQI